MVRKDRVLCDCSRCNNKKWVCTETRSRHRKADQARLSDSEVYTLVQVMRMHTLQSTNAEAFGKFTRITIMYSLHESRQRLLQAEGEEGSGDAGAADAAPVTAEGDVPASGAQQGCDAGTGGDQGPLQLPGDEDDQGPVPLPDDREPPVELDSDAFDAQKFEAWLGRDQQPWVARGKMTRREVVAGVLALQSFFKWSNPVVEAVLSFIDAVVGAAADEHLPQSWAEVERLLKPILATAERW